MGADLQEHLPSAARSIHHPALQGADLPAPGLGRRLLPPIEHPLAIGIDGIGPAKPTGEPGDLPRLVPEGAHEGLVGEAHGRIGITIAAEHRHRQALQGHQAPRLDVE